jgi:cobalt-zinc-cadmium efflux system outer membrane protein
MIVPIAVVVALVAGLGLAVPAPAQEVLELTEDDAVQRLDPAVVTARQAAAGQAAAEGDLAAARVFANPRIEVGREDNLGVTERFALVSQVLPLTGRRWTEVGDAERRLTAARLRAETLDRRLQADVRLAFAALLAAQGRVDVLEAATKRLREVAAAVAEREKAGDAAGFDRLRAEREVAEVEAALVDAIEARVRAQAELAQFLGADVNPASVRAVATATPPAPLPAADVLVERALAERRDLRALEQEREAMRFARRAASRLHVLEPEVTAGVRDSEVGGSGGVLAVAISVPLFSRSAGAQARLAVAERETDAALVTQRARIRSSVLALAAIVTDRRAAVDRFRDAAVARAQDLESVAEVSYENRVRSILELLDAYRAGAGARVRLLELELAAKRAEIELEELTGEAL